MKAAAEVPLVTVGQQNVLWRFRYLTRRLVRGECYGGNGNSKCMAADLDACMAAGLVVCGPGPDRKDGKPGAPRYSLTPAGLAALQRAMEARPVPKPSSRWKLTKEADAKVPKVPGMPWGSDDLLRDRPRDVDQLLDGGTHRLPGRRGAE